MPKIKRNDVVPYVDKVFGYTRFVLLPLGAHIKKFQPEKKQLKKYEEVSNHERLSLCLVQEWVLIKIKITGIQRWSPLELGGLHE